MSHVLILISAPDDPAIDDSLLARIADAAGADATQAQILAPGKAAELPLRGGIDPADAARAAAEAHAGLPVDSVVLPAANRRKRLLLADMDSTMIEIETLDTLAAELGLGDAIAEITRRSMNGELDFAAALRERVAMLAGYPAEDAMQTVMDRVTYTPGGKVAVATMRAYGSYCALVSGGFTFTTETVYAELGFHEHRANVLEVADGTLTGKVAEPIVARDTKLITVRELCIKQGVELEDACTVGDGANDLKMLASAGLGIAFRAKPLVKSQARQSISTLGLDAVLYLIGYRQADLEAGPGELGK